jgi:hypothetical protein
MIRRMLEVGLMLVLVLAIGGYIVHHPGEAGGTVHTWIDGAMTFFMSLAGGKS